MPPKKIPKLDNSQRKLSTFFSMNTEPNEHEKDCDNDASDCPSDKVGQTNAPFNKECKFQSKWLTLWPWLTYNEDATYCKICSKHGKKNTKIASCKTMGENAMYKISAAIKTLAFKATESHILLVQGYKHMHEQCAH